jgi:hypothetical protein
MYAIQRVWGTITSGVAPHSSFENQTEGYLEFTWQRVAATPRNSFKPYCLIDIVTNEGN